MQGEKRNIYKILVGKPDRNHIEDLEIKFYDRMTVHCNRILVNKTNRALNSNFIGITTVVNDCGRRLGLCNLCFIHYSVKEILHSVHVSIFSRHQSRPSV